MTPLLDTPLGADSFSAPLSIEDITASGGIDYAMPSRATFEPGESTEGLPVPHAEFTSGSYWARWTAPRSGVWRFALARGGLGARGELALTFYRDSLAGGRIALITADHPGPVYLKVNQGETIAMGHIVSQSMFAADFRINPFVPDITPAVAGIALAEWYGLPSPADLNASFSSDGIPLLVKHALGLDPLRNSLPGGDDPNASRWPVPSLTPDGDLSLTFRFAAPFQTGDGMELSGEISPDLLSWLPAPEIPAPDGQRTVYLPANRLERFLRLRASLR